MALREQARTERREAEMATAARDHARAALTGRVTLKQEIDAFAPRAGDVFEAHYAGLPPLVLATP